MDRQIWSKSSCLQVACSAVMKRHVQKLQWHPGFEYSRVVRLEYCEHSDERDDVAAVSGNRGKTDYEGAIFELSLEEWVVFICLDWGVTWVERWKMPARADWACGCMRNCRQFSLARILICSHKEDPDCCQMMISKAKIKAGKGKMKI